LCPCKSGKLYKTCCQHYHDGFLPENALVVMRARYAAFALQLVDYIIRTTHPTHFSFTLDKEVWRREILAFAEQTHFEGLRVLNFVEHQKQAEVTFTAYLIAEGKDLIFTETSLFLKEGENWLYQKGKIRPHC